MKYFTFLSHVGTYDTHTKKKKCFNFSGVIIIIIISVSVFVFSVEKV